MKAALIIALALISFACAQDSRWDGTWTDNVRGYTMTTCRVDDVVYGTYADYGYLIGEISSDGLAVGGLFYEAGYTDDSFGEFSFITLPNDDGFTAERSYNHKECAPADWSHTRTSDTEFLETCLPLFDNQILLEPNGTTLSGLWEDANGNRFTLCWGDNFEYYEASYTGPDGTGYSHGLMFEEGRIAKGSFITQFNGGITEGIHIMIFADPFNNNNGTEFTELILFDVDSVLEYDPATTVVQKKTWTRLEFEVPSTIVTNSDGSQTVVNQCGSERSLFPSPWVGSFRDLDFGYGRLNFCPNGAFIYGIYSEIGWISGRIIDGGKSITGRFYDAGDSEQVSGDFTLTRADDPDHFSGTWEFDNSAKKYTWAERRASVIPSTELECLTLWTGPHTVTGSWRYDSTSRLDTLDICFIGDGTRFEASYNFNGGLSRGYMTGYVRENGKALQGEWFEESKQGILFFRLTDRNNLHMVRWNHADIQDSDYFICDDDQGNSDWVKHRSVSFTNRITEAARASSCNRNADLISFAQVGPFTPDGFVDEYIASLFVAPPVPPPPPPIPIPRRRPNNPAPPSPASPSPAAPGEDSNNNNNPAPPSPASPSPAAPDEEVYNGVTFVPRSPINVNAEDDDAGSAIVPSFVTFVCVVAVLFCTL